MAHSPKNIFCISSSVYFWLFGIVVSGTSLIFSEEDEGKEVCVLLSSVLDTFGIDCEVLQPFKKNKEIVKSMSNFFIFIMSPPITNGCICITILT